MRQSGHGREIIKNSCYSLLIIFLVACTDPSDQSYFPLDEGLQWRYSVIKTTMDGTRQQKYFFLNLPKKVIEGKELYARQSIDGTVHYYINTDDGITLFGKEISTGLNKQFIGKENIVFKYPLAVDKQWDDITYSRLLEKTGPPQKTEFKIIAKVPLSVVVESIDDVVSVPAGTFHNCIRIKKKGSVYKDAGNYIGLTIVSVSETSWFAPGVGLVKSVREESTEQKALDRGELIIELESFTS